MIRKIKKLYRKILRYNLNRNNRNRLENRNITIISANCVGGVIYHELGLEFDSPTINLYFEAQDYVKFVTNLKKYLTYELVEIDSENDYPCALCGDITLHMVHYNSFCEAKAKWEERKERINYENLYFIMVDRDGCKKEDVLKFNELPYKNKVFLTYKDYSGIECAVKIEGTEEGNQIRDICQYKSKFTGKRWLDGFDYVEFLNKK